MWASSQATWWVLELVSRTEQGACLPQCSQQLCGGCSACWMQRMRLDAVHAAAIQCIHGGAVRASLAGLASVLRRLGVAAGAARFAASLSSLTALLATVPCACRHSPSTVHPACTS